MDKIIHLSLTKKNVPIRIDVVQYATKPNIVFVLDDFTPQAGSTASLYIKKPDGSEIFNSCTIYENTVTYTPTTQSFAALGTNKCQLQIVEQDGTAVSYIVYADVTENIIDSEAVESQDEFTALEEALREIGDVVLHDDTRGAVKLNGDLTIQKAQPTINLTNSGTNNARSKIVAYPIDSNGNNVVLQAGGNLIMGGGEYADNRYNASLTDNTGEDTYIGADRHVYIESGGQTISNAMRWQFLNSGNLVLPKNGSYLSAIDKDGNIVNGMLDLLNASNNTSLGYGSFQNNLGETNIYAGARINIFAKTDVAVWVKRGESDQKRWLFTTAGNLDGPVGALIMGVDIPAEKARLDKVILGTTIPTYASDGPDEPSVVDTGDSLFTGYITNNKKDLHFFIPTPKSCVGRTWNQGGVSPFRGNISIRGTKGYVNGTQYITILYDDNTFTATMTQSGIKLKIAMGTDTAELMTNVDNNTPLVLNGRLVFTLA